MRQRITASHSTFASHLLRRLQDFVEGKVVSAVKAGVAAGDPRRIWLNPDCGLKTRTWPEVLPALRTVVRAAEALRVQHACA